MHRLSGAVILKIAYGYEVKEKDDPLVELVDRSVRGFIKASTAGSYLVDSLHARESIRKDICDTSPHVCL